MERIQKCCRGDAIIQAIDYLSADYHDVHSTSHYSSIPAGLRRLLQLLIVSRWPFSIYQTANIP